MLLHAIDAALLDAIAALLLYLWHRNTNPTPTPIGPPNPFPGPINPMPTTIADVIAVKKTADGDEQAKKDAAAKADADYASAQQATIDANTTLKMDLIASGPVFTTDTTGVEIWVTDASSLGFHSFRPLDASATPVPDPVPPAPGPTPVVDPVPSPVAPVADVTPGV